MSIQPMIKIQKGEVMEHWGAEFPGKVFFVCRRSTPGGFISNVQTAMVQVRRAIELGCVPVIDYQAQIISSAA